MPDVLFVFLECAGMYHFDVTPSVCSLASRDMTGKLASRVNGSMLARLQEE